MAVSFGSALPTILLALNRIIIWISLILLIPKELILYPISTRSSILNWIRHQLDSYFYYFQLLFIAIVIMSNRYVGYGRLVFYSFVSLLYTILLVSFLFWLLG